MKRFLFWHNMNESEIDSNSIQNVLLKHMPEGNVINEKINENTGIIAAYNTNKPILKYSNNGFLFCSTDNIKIDSLNTANTIELVSKSIEQGNEIPFDKFHQSFSFIGYNKITHTVSIATDKFGIEKMYYMKTGNSFLASNSLEAIQACHPEPLVLNNQAIYHYIDSHVIPSPYTIYENVFKLEPSQSITFAQDKHQEKIYWIPDFSESPSKSIQELEETAQELMDNAVAEVSNNANAATFLSGGLDSSTITGYFAKNNTRKVASYTMGFDEAGYDETEFAEIASRHFKTDLRHYNVTPDDVANAFTKVITGYDEPFGNSSSIPSYLCAKFAASEGISDMLAGDGGDEIFAGNERYAKQHVFEHYKKIPPFIAEKLLKNIFVNSLPYNKVQPFAKIKSYIEQAITPMPDRMERYNFINHFGNNKIFTENFLNGLDCDIPISEKRKTYNRPKDASMLNRMLYMDWKFTLADNDLVKVTTACDLAGIQVHYPMLNDEFVRFSTQIPSGLKMKNGTELRSFYKNAFDDFLPSEIIHKSKHGFGLPFGEWLKKSPQLQQKMYDNLESLKKRNIVQPKFIDNIIEIHRTDAAASYFGTMVWILAVLEEWLSSRSL